MNRMHTTPQKHTPTQHVHIIRLQWMRVMMCRGIHHEVKHTHAHTHSLHIMCVVSLYDQRQHDACYALLAFSRTESTLQEAKEARQVVW